MVHSHTTIPTWDWHTTRLIQVTGSIGKSTQPFGLLPFIRKRKGCQTVKGTIIDIGLNCCGPCVFLDIYAYVMFSGLDCCLVLFVFFVYALCFYVSALSVCLYVVFLFMFMFLMFIMFFCGPSCLIQINEWMSEGIELTMLSYWAKLFLWWPCTSV